MKIMVGIIIAILLTTIFFLFWPDISELTETSSLSTQEQATEEVITATISEQPKKKIVIEYDSNGEEMKSEYNKLESARLELKRALAKTKHLLWGMTFPSEQAKKINAVMLNAHKFEKTPRMLGAFFDAKEIRSEIEKVNFAKNALIDLEKLVSEAEPTN